MDKFSFLNSAHTSFFAEMYDQYLESPDSLEPSWKAFFQGFDFGLENANITVEEKKFEVPENIKKEFQVSKKVFKQAIGGLYKQGKIRITNEGIELV